MNGKLIAVAAGAACALLAGQAQARPYLMLSADNKGFQALDLGDIHQQGIDTAQITLITAPLAGAPYADGKLAAIRKERLEFECQGERWRVVALGFADAKDQPLASDPGDSVWKAAAKDDAQLAIGRDAACLRRYREAMVSRVLNLGEIVSNYHKAWGPAAPEYMTERQLLKRKFEANH
jgi:hypothetical protein